MARIRDWPALIFLSSAMAVMASIVSIALDALVYPFAAAGRMFAELWRPDATMAINLAGRDLVDYRQPGIASRFANFIKRAMNHDDFAAGHFDPGRMPA